jgi:4-diphosphocytidyl-2-C-methyl-D-erythritol kinase
VPITVRSFAKINLGLYIGDVRADRFHELRTVYQTIGLHDVLHVSAEQGSGIEIRCKNPSVPTDKSNTCYAMAERVMEELGVKRRVVLEIEKHLPVQGGLGGASSNAVATLFALELALGKRLAGDERLRLAGEVGSDLPLFLIGGTILGLERGEAVYPLPELPATPCVVVAPKVGVSTPQAFADWDKQVAQKLTPGDGSSRMLEFGRKLSAWLSGNAGAPAGRGGRVGNPLLDLVHAGIANDFERVVFQQNPELSELKRELLRLGAYYASLSGSGSALYGLFARAAGAKRAAKLLKAQGVPAFATVTLPSAEYWKKFRMR